MSEWPPEAVPAGALAWLRAACLAEPYEKLRLKMAAFLATDA